MKPRFVHDASGLPDYTFGRDSILWWGTLGFVAIEGTGFALAVGAYLYFAAVGPPGQFGPAPSTIWPGTALTILLVLSLVPNWWANRVALRQDMRLVRVALILMSIIGMLTIVLRGFEIAYMNIRWDLTGYGSAVWFILGLHATHLVTDVGDTVVLAALMFTRHAQPRRFSDVTDNAFYWYFVVGSWVLLYALIYWFPKLVA